MLIISYLYLERCVFIIQRMLFSMFFNILMLPVIRIYRLCLHHARLSLLLTLDVYSLNIPDIPCHSGPCPKGKK
jgi:hypothetical protein